VLVTSPANDPTLGHADKIVLEFVVLLVDRLVVAEDASVLLSIALGE
jgi:hypothetical protein